MKQDEVGGKILLELLERGIIQDEHQEIVFDYLIQAYAAGHDAGRQLRSYTKPVVQLSLKGDVIDIFESVQDAVRKTGLNKSNIANCARGRKGCLTAGGFRWQYITTRDPISSETETIRAYRSGSDPPK